MRHCRIAPWRVGSSAARDEKEENLSVRGSSQRGTRAQRVFVAALIVVGLIVSYVVVLRIDPRPATPGHGAQVAAHLQNGSEASRR